MTRVLYLYGGWPGHKPYEVADGHGHCSRSWLRGRGDNDIFALDADLTATTLIALNWNNALVSEGLTLAQETSLLTAVEQARRRGLHGGRAGFRTSLKYHWLLGGSFLEHARR